MVLNVLKRFLNFPAVSVANGSIKSEGVTLTLRPSADARNIYEYIVLYKPSSVTRVWSFKRTKQTQVELPSLKALTKYSVLVLGYTTSKETYGSRVLYFVAPNGTLNGLYFLCFVISLFIFEHYCSQIMKIQIIIRKYIILFPHQQRSQ